MALTTKRIIALPSQTDPQEGDYLAIDNAQGGTHKIPVGRIGVEVDDTLTEAGKAADAKATGDALDEIRSQIEVTGTASGTIATFTDGANAPMKSCMVSIVPKQSGTGTPSPDNVRPISGWSSVDVIKSGVNVWDEEWEVGDLSGTDGTPISSTAYIRSKNFCPCKAEATYYLIKGTAIKMYIFWYDASETHISHSIVTADRTMSAPSNAKFFKLTIAGATYNNDISINYPSTDHDYHAYNGQTITKALGQTVYECEVDIVSGVLTVDRAMVDLGTLTWTYDANNTWFWASVSGRKGGRSDLICSQYAYYGAVRNEVSHDGEIANWSAQTAPEVVIRDTRYTSASDFKTAVSGVQLVYELATPQTYTLTPTQINTLLGENNVWADSGDISVTYVRDLNIAINNLIGE